MGHQSTLNQIGLKHGTDKSSSWHNYLEFYEDRLSKHRSEKFTMIEVGVLNGGSLRTWSEYFSNATVVGMDINPETTQHAGGNRHVVIGDASRLELIDDVVRRFGSPMLVVEDGSHIWHHQIESLRYFWPKLLPGGTYIMEDVHTSFSGVYKLSPQFVGHSAISAYDYVAKLARCVVGAEDLGEELPYDGFISNYAPTIRSIEWYRRTCIITKKSD